MLKGMKRGSIFVIITIFASSVQANTAAVDCKALVAEARTLKNDVTALRQLHGKSDIHCPLSVSTRLGQALAFALYRKSSKLEDQDSRKAALLEATKYSQHWKIQAALATEHAQSREWAAAAERYQGALAALNRLPEGKLPPTHITETLIRRANNARGAADEYVAGLGFRNIGGVQIEAIPFPIEFHFAKTTFTEKGELAFEDLARIIEAEKVARITLIGHTDPIGSNAYNKQLSFDRAQAVRDALLAKLGATTIDIIVEGHGEAEPPILDDGFPYSEEERHQIARRVELIW